ncbi:MAG: alpha/beta hydrolase [Anaerolineaceae bacterium]|nr:alpha/beta hydrolase [Anaerolineaceae bacterium]
MSGVVIDNEVCHYEVMGHGRPVLFLHDWLGTWRYWMPAMQIVSSLNYKTIAVDLWGFGDTARNKRAYSIQDQTRLIAKFLTQMKLEKVAIVGHGLGAVIAMNFAKQYYHSVDRLFLVSCPMSDTSLNERLFEDTPYDLVNWLLDKDEDAHFVLEEIHKIDLQSLRVSLQEVKQMDLINLWKVGQHRSLFVHGVQDQAIVSPSERRFLVLEDHMHGILIEGGGHYPMLEDSSKFSRLLVDFLMLEKEVSPRNITLKDKWIRRVR